mgnify:CR=1 FL=1
MSATVETLDISPVGRVEGDLDVRVDIENGVVTNAWTHAEMFRGFEVILKDTWVRLLNHCNPCRVTTMAFG